MQLSNDFKTGVAYAKSWVLVENVGGIEHVAAMLGDETYRKWVAAREAIDALHKDIIKEVQRLAQEDEQ